MIRVEEENESLVMQLKKMAMKKGTQHWWVIIVVKVITHLIDIEGRRTTPDSSIDKDEGISDEMEEMTLSDLRIQLELNEQVFSISLLFQTNQLFMRIIDRKLPF